MNDFAWLGFASPGRGKRTTAPSRTWRKAALCLFAIFILTTANGCSYVGKLWPFGGQTVNRIDEIAENPEQIAAALEATRVRMQLAPEEPYWPFHMGELYGATDSTAQATSHLKVALDINPTYAPAAALLSKLYYQSGTHEEAVTLLDGFVTGDADTPDALRAALALHLEALGELDRAQAVLDDCADNSKEARAARTFVSLRGNDLEPVLNTAKQALEDDPRSAVNHNNYGIALLHAGRPVEARKAFEDALALNKALPGALYNMAIVEAFYFFNEEAGRQWFARYKQHASDDPDDLTSAFGTDLSGLLNPEDTK